MAGAQRAMALLAVSEPEGSVGEAPGLSMDTDTDDAGIATGSFSPPPSLPPQRTRSSPPSPIHPHAIRRGHPRLGYGGLGNTLASRMWRAKVYRKEYRKAAKLSEARRIQEVKNRYLGQERRFANMFRVLYPWKSKDEARLFIQAKLQALKETGSSTGHIQAPSGSSSPVPAHPVARVPPPLEAAMAHLAV